MSLKPLDMAEKRAPIVWRRDGASAGCALEPTSFPSLFDLHLRYSTCRTTNFIRLRDVDSRRDINVDFNASLEDLQLLLQKFCAVRLSTQHVDGHPNAE
jgi:hypothetical protein